MQVQSLTSAITYYPQIRGDVASLYPIADVYKDNAPTKLFSPAI